MKKTFSVSGMKCSHCAANVENALKAVKGVVSAEAQISRQPWMLPAAMN